MGLLAAAHDDRTPLTGPGLPTRPPFSPADPPLAADVLCCLYCGELPVHGDIRAAAQAHTADTAHPTIFRSPDPPPINRPAATPPPTDRPPRTSRRADPPRTGHGPRMRHSAPCWLGTLRAMVLRP